MRYDECCRYNEYTNVDKNVESATDVPIPDYASTAHSMVTRGTRMFLNKVNNFENGVLSDVTEIKTTGKKLYDEKSFVGLAIIDNMNNKTRTVKNTLDLDSSRVNFEVQIGLQSDVENVLIIATYMNNTEYANDRIKKTVITGSDGDNGKVKFIPFKVFSCSVYDATNFSYIHDTTLEFTIHNISTTRNWKGKDKTRKQISMEPICLFFDDIQM
ncbi:uncharacterized protein [Antedon mediterranea]|uniref:uncharacterized protein n=1 Tax=Antedon mediterranea TaxID=105859 RepID=UPI003AF876AB